MLAVLLVLPRITTTDPGGARRRGRRHHRVGRASTWPPTASPPSARSPRACPARRCRGRAGPTSAPLLVGAVGITMVSLTDTIATATSFAARRGDEVDPDQEMVGIGTANVAAGFFQGFAVSVSGSRTAVADQAGAKTAGHRAGRRRSGRAAAAVPQRAAGRPAPDRTGRGGRSPPRCRSWTWARCAATPRSGPRRSSSAWSPSAGVIFLGVLQGIVVAIVLAMLLFFRRNWWPHGAVLGEVPEIGGWHSIAESSRGAESARHRRVPVGGTRCSSPTAASSATRSAALVRDREPDWVVLQCEAVTDIDVTAADVLRDLDEELNAQGRPPRLRRAPRPPAGPRPPVRPAHHPRPRALLPQPRPGAGSHRHRHRLRPDPAGGWAGPSPQPAIWTGTHLRGAFLSTLRSRDEGESAGGRATPPMANRVPVVDRHRRPRRHNWSDRCR